jgi:phosphocarrier protein
VTITNKLGLHARPAMMFVEVASRFDSHITVSRQDDSEAVDGKSIMQMMMLAATRGTAILITAKGDDAPEAVAELVTLVESNFCED